MEQQLNILRYMDQIRRLMADRGVCEVPQYPEPLQRVWYHPDLLVTARSGSPAHCFCFQTIWNRGTGAAAGCDSCTPAFVWLMDCSEKNFSAAVADFISDLHFAMTNSREDSGFALIADRCQGGAVRDRGCCWQLLYYGVSCGQICLFSEMFFQPLARPAVIMVLDLAKLPGLHDPKSLGQPVLWGNGAVASDMLALRAWQLRSSADVNQQKHADSGMELCRLISRLNSGIVDSSKDSEALKQLSASVSEAVQQLLSERSANKVVVRDDKK